MRIDVIDDARRADQIMTLALHAERVLVQEGNAFGTPTFRAIECAGNRVTRALVVTIAFTLFAPSNRAMDRWADGHCMDLDDGDGHNGNTRMGQNLRHEAYPGPLPKGAQHLAGSYLNPLRRHQKSPRSDA